jgi:uncharacterized protein (DUF433 family)
MSTESPENMFSEMKVASKIAISRTVLFPDRTKLTEPPEIPRLNMMEVHFTPELEKKINDLAAKTGQAPEELLEDALAGYGVARMAALDWSQCPAVESVPGKVSGAWVFKDTRMPVSVVFENLEAGATIDEIVEWFDVTPQQVKDVLDFAARSLKAPVPRR